MTGVAEALVSLVGDITAPLLLLVAAVCWILAACAFMAGALRLIQHAAGGRPPSGLGTAMWFVVAVVLLRLPAWIGSAGRTLFGAAPSNAQVTLGYGGRSADWSGTIEAVLAIVSLIGLIAVIRGLFALRAAADGNGRETVGGAAMHILGGVCAWHIAPFIAAIQTTLGVDVLQIG